MESMKKQLAEKAIEMMARSYSPYSNFCVGAALLCADGSIYTGCNIENAGLTATNCAERTAFFKAVSEGKRDFVAIAVTGGRNGHVTDYTAPCGVCRQVMAEFCDPKSFLVHIVRKPEDIRTFTLEELLPLSFGPASLLEPALYGE